MEEHHGCSSSHLSTEAAASARVLIEEEEERDPELQHPLIRRHRALSSSPLAIVGATVSYIESLDYEINENDLFKHDWRRRSRVQVLQYVLLKWTLAFLVGLFTGLIATLVNLAVENIAGYKILAVVNLIKQQRYWTGLAFMTGVNLVLTTFAAGLCVFFAPTAAGPGIPEIKAYLNGIDTPNMFGATTLIVKIFGSIGAVSAGLDLGKEGPLVHIGSCIAALLGQGGPDNHRLQWKWFRYFNNDRDRRDIITCGASSGVCAAFRSPVGGVLFALEEVATWWRSVLLWRTFFSTAVVVVILRAFIEICSSPGRCGLFGAGGLIMFDVSSVTVRYHLMDVIPVVLIGVIGGVLGSLYNHLLHKVLRLYNLINQKGKIHKLLLAMTVSVFTSVCLYCLPFLAKCQPCDPSIQETCPTNTRSGNFKQFNCPDGHYNDLASLLLTTTSLMAGSMRMTVSLCVIFLELTNNLLLLPITMIVLLIAKSVGDSFNPSIYEIILELKGLPFLDAKPEPWMRSLTVSELINAKQPVVTLCGVETVSRIVDILKNTTHHGFPVVDEGTELHGLILRAHLVKALKKKWFMREKRRRAEWEVRERFTWVDLIERQVDFEEVMTMVSIEEMDMYVDLHPFINSTPFTVIESMSVAKAMVLFRQVGLRHLLVLPKYQAPGSVVGILTRQDLRAYNILTAFPHLARSKTRGKHN
ncbi:Chloride channel protein CLC-a [Linum perenne]